MQNAQKEKTTTRFVPDINSGLTREQVERRIGEGLDNQTGEIKTKSVWAIVKDNLCTLFNFVNFALALIVILIGSYRNALFITIILANLVIGIAQEIRAKRTIDKLSLISAPRALVVREGAQQSIPVEQVVLDDVLEYMPGKQICADSKILQGFCEVDESLLTGESDPVLKKEGEMLLSGSYIVSGQCRAQAMRIGRQNYASKITADVKKIKKPNSQILKSLNTIIKTISLLILPIGAILFVKQYYLLSETLERSVTSTVAAIIGMIPEGLILLTSVVLAIGVIRLSRQKTLVQELYCIETLARVDVLCIDKTGTITEGNLRVSDVQSLEPGLDVVRVLGELAGSLPDTNGTFLAIKAYVKTSQEWKCSFCAPFSPARKWSGCSYEGHGSYVLGAPEILLDDTEKCSELSKRISGLADQGIRVVLLSHSKEELTELELPGQLSPAALILLKDTIRKDAPKTLDFFAREGVAIKIISGDNPKTVAAIAKEAGLSGAEKWVDALELDDEQLMEAAKTQNIFGRVSPYQKRLIVKTLQNEGHTVAMTGDGVNDVLALRDSDCSIAMASGSDAARNVSQLVLLDSNFASMTKVVKEGRRAINNISRSASMFLVKTIYSLLLSVIFIFTLSPYPFVPIQLSLISTITVGVPSFFLALEPNKERVKGEFLVGILRNAIPGALIVVLYVSVVHILGAALTFSDVQMSTLCMMLTAVVTMLVLARISWPFNWYRLCIFVLVVVGFVGAVLILPEFFYIAVLTRPMVWILTIGVALVLPIILGIQKLIDCVNFQKYLSRLDQKVTQRGKKKKNR